MYHPIEKIIFAYYHLNLFVERQLENGYFLSNQNFCYTLLEVTKENERIFMFQSKYLPKIIPTIYQTQYFNYNNQCYCLFEFLAPSDLGIANQYLSALYHLNEETLVTQTVDVSFYEKQCDYLKRKIEDTYTCFETIIHNFVSNTSLNVLFFSLIYEYDIILNLKQTALKCLKEYKELVKGKSTGRFCLCLNQVDYPAFCIEKNCFTDLNLIKFDLVMDNVIQLFKTNIEYEDLERLYINHFSFEKHERLYIVIELLCLEMIDFTLDGYKNIVWFVQFKRYVNRVNKIMKLLQIEENILYN